MFTPELPKTRSGKIMRRLLRDIANGTPLGDTTTLADATVVDSIRTDSASRTYYDRKRSEGKTHTQAVIALARRRLNVLWAMLRDHAAYQPTTTAAAA